MIRRARPDDVDAVALVFRRAYGTLTFLPTLHTAAEDRRHFADVVAEREVWVYEDDGSVVGYAALANRVLTDLYVDPARQREGIGGTLLEHAKERRPDGLELWVFQRNDGARRFYERHGCHLARLTDGSGNEEREPDALYSWSPRSA